MRRFFWILAAAVGALRPTQLSAIVVPPVGLLPGSQYQLLFVTSGVHDAISSDIADYNAFVQQEAALNPLLPSATWRAVASTAMVDANANAPSNGFPIYNTGGIEVASAATGLYTSSLLSAIRYDQNGSDVYLLGNQGSTVWSGSNIAGQSYSPLGSSEPMHGHSTDQNSAWLADQANFLNTNVSHFYALSSPLIFVPEPDGLPLAGAAALLLSACVVRRRRLTSRRARAAAPPHIIYGV